MKQNRGEREERGRREDPGWNFRKRQKWSGRLYFLLPVPVMATATPTMIPKITKITKPMISFIYEGGGERGDERKEEKIWAVL
jgi:hypothetical protein